VHVDAGDRVAAGRTLVQLDSALAKLSLQRAEAALQEARAQLAENERLRDEAASLVERNFLPQTRLAAAEADLRVAAAAVDRLEAERRQQAELVSRHSVVAPFAGVVSRKLTDAGEWVETGTPVLELVDTSRLRVDVQVPQEHYRMISVGAPASVRLDSNAGRALEGKVSARVPVSDPGARTFLARVEVAGGGARMTPGMSALVTFALSSDETAVRVPRDAVLRRPDGSTSVWVAGEGATPTVSKRDIEIDRSLRDFFDVHSGLEAGARVVVRGNETLTEGQRVRVLNAGTPASGD
jgi:membrane fusion protein, multidrug efflux system